MNRAVILPYTAALAFLLASSAWANDRGKTPDPAPEAHANAEADAAAEADANATSDADAAAESASSAVSNIESEHQAPSTFIGAAAPTAPCYYVNSVGISVPIGGGGRSKARRDDDCWAEYITQAEHQRQLDRDRLEVERRLAAAEELRAQAERDRARAEVLRLEQCFECEQLK
jgi:hypothetical protein